MTVQQDFFTKNTEDNISYIDEIKESFLDYSMSVITSRALPDIRDGLKPVQRRILYAMYSEGLTADKKFSKCAGIVGEVLKKYHPHGDTAVYDALVRMAQAWVMRYPLAEGQGNFGSLDGDSAAAYRYTEARLDKLSSYLMSDIDQDTVDMSDNYNNTGKEPTVLPSGFPNLLLNGASGIAVGMATNIPPHNLGELMDALILLLKQPDISVKELMSVVKGPDFPTGAAIIDDGSIVQAYETGKGVVRLRAEIAIEKEKDKKRLVIKEVPYGVVKSRITSKIYELIKSKKLDGIIDIRDESNQEGVRIVLDLSRTAPEDFIIGKLYKNTPLDSNFAVNMVCLVDGKPQLVGLKKMLQLFVEFREEIVRRRTIFELNKSRDKQHILEGFKKALDNKDRYLKEILPKSKDKQDLKTKVEKEFGLTPVQSEALVVLPNYRFSGLEVEKIMAEHLELSKYIKELEDILNSDQKIKKILKDEFLEIKSKFADVRRTRIVQDFEDKKLEELIPSKEVFVAVTNSGFIKRYEPSSEQGERQSNVVFTGDDVVRFVCKADLSQKIILFSSQGKAYPLRVFSVPEMRRYGKGIEIKELIKTKEELKIVGIVDENIEQEVVLLTAKGCIKKISTTELKGMKSNGVSIFSVRKGDDIVAVKTSSLKYLWVIQSKGGLKEIDVSTIETTPRGKAPEKICEGVESFCAVNSKELEKIFVYPEGSLKAQMTTKIKPCGIIYKPQINDAVEFVAFTSLSRYLLIDTNQGSISLEPQEKVISVFSFRDNLTK